MGRQAAGCGWAQGIQRLLAGWQGKAATLERQQRVPVWGSGPLTGNG